MEKELLETLEVLKIFNEKLDAHIGEKEFKEETDNVDDFVKEKEKLKLILQQIKKNNWTNKELVEENLVDLHLTYSNFIWHFEQIYELIIKIIRNYYPIHALLTNKIKCPKRGKLLRFTSEILTILVIN